MGMLSEWSSLVTGEHLLAFFLAVALLVSQVRYLRLRRRERRMIEREAALQAREAVAADRAEIETARLEQRFQEGIREGVRRIAEEDEAYRLAFEKGVLEGRRQAEDDIRVEYWTEVRKDQGYFFTSAEVVACYQLVYKNIPLGPPQRRVLEKNESIDKGSMEAMFERILGDSAALPAEAASRRIRLVNRADEAAEERPRALRGR